MYSPAGLESRAALDDQSAFIASLGSNRSPRMRDVLGTIQADQDAIIRAGSRGALVVDGGPGTGKTVVALHRTAYLLYSDPRLGHRQGGVLFVGPHQPYLAYVADVLPSLGEEGVQTCTLRDLVPEGATAAHEPDPDVARLKSSAEMVKAIEPAVRFYEEPPTKGMQIDTPYVDIWVSRDDWADAFDAPPPGTPHNEARDQIWEELLTHPGGQDRGRRRGRRGRRREMSRPTWSAGRLRRAGSSPTPSTRRGHSSRRPTSSATCGRCRRTCACAHRGSTRRTSGSSDATTQAPGPSRTCRSWTPPGNGSAIPRHHAAGVVMRQPSPPNAQRMDRVVDEILQADDDEG